MAKDNEIGYATEYDLHIICDDGITIHDVMASILSNYDITCIVSKDNPVKYLIKKNVKKKSPLMDSLKGN